MQRQIITFLLILVVAWYIPEQFQRWWRRRQRRQRTPSSQPESRADESSARTASRVGYRLQRAIPQMFFPLLAIALGVVADWIFVENAWLHGLLDQGQRLFLLLLVYRVLVALLYVVLPEEQAVTYHNRVLKPLLVLAIVVGLNEILTGVQSFTDQRLFTVADNDIKVGSFFWAGVVFYLFLLLSWLLRDALTHVVLPRVHADPGTANTILTITQYIIIASGMLSALATIGLDLSSLAIIGAGLSVGIGFGLQELVANFISGILLLFEQSIRPGDVVQLDDTTIGTVEKLRIRSTTIRTRDNVEIVVPNQSLLTSSVTTYTHSERLIRLNIPVGVGYGSDPQEVRDVLLAAGRRHGLVRKRPAPTVFFEGYGDSSIDFALAVWIENAELMRPIRSDLRFIIWEELKQRDIEIPFPQRDLHIRSGIPWEDLAQREEDEPKLASADEPQETASQDPAPNGTEVSANRTEKQDSERPVAG